MRLLEIVVLLTVGLAAGVAFARSESISVPAGRLGGSIMGAVRQGVRPALQRLAPAQAPAPVAPSATRGLSDAARVAEAGLADEQDKWAAASDEALGALLLPETEEDRVDENAYVEKESDDNGNPVAVANRGTVESEQPATQQGASVDLLAAQDIPAVAALAGGPEGARGRSEVKPEGGFQGRAGLLFPLPAGARLSSPWGVRTDPFNGLQSWHAGIDLAAAEGASVVAAHSGRCAARYSLNGGWTALVSSSRLVTGYGHLGSVACRGRHVNAGEVIGTVGCTGRRCTAPHLHYVLWIDGRQVDPVSSFPPSAVLFARR